MKTIHIFSALFFLINLTQAQSSTSGFLNKIPAIPKESCQISKTDVETFQKQVNSLDNEIKTQIRLLRQKENAQAKNSEAQAKQTAMQQMGQQYGLSQEEMNKMQSGKMSDADKKALANKMMQQQTNMSMEEVQNLGKMSEAGKKAYMEAYGTEAMATSSQPNAAQKKESEKAKDSFELMKEQQSVMAKTNSASQKIGSLYAAIENDPKRTQMLDNIEKMQSKWSSMIGANGGQGDRMDSLAVKIKNEQKKYCELFTPQYHNAVNQHLTILRNSLPDQLRLGEITAEIAKAQTGIEIPAECAEIGNLESLRGYLDKLENAYQYKLYYPE
jgi:DNA polymerase III gamma/tau subunit